MLDTTGCANGARIETSNGRFVNIEGFPGYRVSDLGEVQSCRVGGTWRTLAQMNVRGYRVVNIYKDKKGKPSQVHRLVLVAFRGNCPEGMEACHNNGIRSDNRLENLRWDTRKNNHADKIIHGTRQCGEGSGSCKYPEDQIVEILNRLANGETQRSIASDYGVTQGYISNLKRGVTWPHIDRGFMENKARTKVVLGHKERQEVRQLIGLGKSDKEIATQYGVSKTTIWRIRTK